MIKYQLPRSKQKKKSQLQQDLPRLDNSLIWLHLLSSFFLIHTCEDHARSMRVHQRNDDRNPLTNVPRALDVTPNKLNKLFKKTGDFGFRIKNGASAAWHGTKSCCDGAWAKVSTWNTSYGRFIYIYIYIYNIYNIDISRYLQIHVRTITYLRTWIMKLLSNTLSNNLWRCWNHVYSVYSIKEHQRTRLCASVLRWLFLACVSCAKEMARSVAFVQPGTFQVQHFLCPTCLRLVLWSCFPKANDSNGIVCLWIQKYSEYLELSCKYAKHLWMWMYWEH